MWALLYITIVLYARYVLATNYVFPAFTDASESNLYVYQSTDATNFNLLKGPAYEPSGTLIRDPSVIKHSDGLYYICYTTNWAGRDFAIIRSANLKTWALHTTVTISNTTVTRTWAPEFFRDTQTGQLHIIVSLGPDGPAMRPNLFTATDNTMLHWTGPVPLTGIEPNYIDTFVVQKNGQYHAFTKNEDNGQKHVEHAVASQLQGPYTFVQKGNFAGWGNAEGPCVTTLDNGNYRLYADGYDSGKYIYSDSPDLYTWSAYKTLPDGLSGWVRHGTVLRLAEVETVVIE